MRKNLLEIPVDTNGIRTLGVLSVYSAVVVLIVFDQRNLIGKTRSLAS